MFRNFLIINFNIEIFEQLDGFNFNLFKIITSPIFI